MYDPPAFSDVPHHVAEPPLAIDAAGYQEATVTFAVLPHFVWVMVTGLLGAVASLFVEVKAVLTHGDHGSFVSVVVHVAAKSLGHFSRRFFLKQAQFYLAFQRVSLGH